MRELAVQAQNGTLQDADKEALALEFDALEAEVTRISDSTTWGGMQILAGAVPSGHKFLVGPAASDTITHVIANMAATAIGLLAANTVAHANTITCLLYTSPSPRDKRQSRMPSSA